jgi:hypothetical protein
MIIYHFYYYPLIILFFILFLVHPPVFGETLVFIFELFIINPYIVPNHRKLLSEYFKQKNFIGLKEDEAIQQCRINNNNPRITIIHKTDSYMEIYQISNNSRSKYMPEITFYSKNGIITDYRVD